MEHLLKTLHLWDLRSNEPFLWNETLLLLKKKSIYSWTVHIVETKSVELRFVKTLEYLSFQVYVQIGSVHV